MPLSLHRLHDPVSAGLVPLIGLPYEIARFCLLRGGKFRKAAALLETERNGDRACPKSYCCSTHLLP